MIIIRLVLSLLICLIFGLSHKVKAQDTTLTDKLIETSDNMAKEVDKIGQNLDVALAGKRYVKKPNESSITIRQLGTWSEGGIFNQSTDFGINLRLPNLEKRWQLRFSSYDEFEEERDLNQRRVRTRARERKPGAALVFLKNLGKIKTTFQPRLVIRDPLHMSYVLRFESQGRYRKFQVLPRLEFFADPEKATGQYASLNFNWDVTKFLTLSLLNEQEYRERDNLLSVNHGVAADYSLNDSQAVGVSFSTNSTNRGAYHLESYAVALAFAHELHPDRLRYSISPFLNFTRPEAFKGDAGVTAQIELKF